MNQLDLSIIIPTYRREHEVVKAVRSVLAITELSVEVLVADDSPDGSAEPHLAAIQDARFRYTKRAVPTGGKPATVRNDLAATAEGRYFYFLDDDDTADPATLVAMVRSLDRSGHGVAIGAVKPFGPDGHQVVREEQKHYEEARHVMRRLRTRFMLVSQLLFKNSVIACSACMIRSDCFRKLGGFDPTIPLYEDVTMYIRAIRHFGYDYVDRLLLNRRTGEPSLIQNERDAVRTLQSYRMMHDGYRAEFKLPEYVGLKLLSYVLPSAPSQ